MRQQIPTCEVSAEPCEQAGKDTAYCKVGGIGKHSRRCGDGKSGEKLSEVMEESAQCACEEGKLALQQAIDRVHDGEAEEAAGKAVKQT